MLANHIAGCQYCIQVVAADDMPDHQHARQQTKPATGRDRKGHPRPATRIQAVMPVTNQQKGSEAGQLPEHHQLNEVSGENHPQHCASEGQKEGEEARHGIFGRHVVARVEHHQKADTLHQQREQPGQAVHAQDKIQTVFRQPGHLKTHYLTGLHLRKLQTDEHQAGEHDGPRQPGLAVARIGGHQRRYKAAEKGQKQQHQQHHRR